MRTSHVPILLSSLRTMILSAQFVLTLISPFYSHVRVCKIICFTKCDSDKVLVWSPFISVSQLNYSRTSAPHNNFQLAAQQADYSCGTTLWNWSFLCFGASGVGHHSAAFPVMLSLHSCITRICIQATWKLHCAHPNDLHNLGETKSWRHDGHPATDAFTCMPLAVDLRSFFQFLVCVN